MKTDIQIAQESHLKPIEEIGASLSIKKEALESYGSHKAKIDISKIENRKSGKLVLVTAINPTPAGEGKTTTNVGLSMALNALGKSSISALREPSLGPCFGMKGGASGGGYAQVLPMEDINLHFTGDFHAITSAHNLLSALLENHIFHGNALNIDPHNIVWKHVLDMNDRSLRNIEVSKDKLKNSIPHASGFDITVASEVMAILCLSKDVRDLKDRLGEIVVAYTYDLKPIYAKDLDSVGAMALLLKDAIKPNLVQTIENTPAIIHGGPFANIAHGCNSLIATKTAMKLCDYTITEAGFGADLGAEKFFNIKCRQGNLNPDATVLVATIRALKYNGGAELKHINDEDLQALELGLPNLDRHFNNLKKFGVPIVVAINAFPSDTEKEIQRIYQWGKDNNVVVVLSNVYAQGSKGGLELAQAVVDACELPKDFKVLYDDDLSISEKIEVIAKEIYGASGVNFSEKAKAQLKTINEWHAHLNVCMAKTQYSFSDDPSKLGAPHNFTITIQELKLSKGAGFVVALTGKIMTMPGLPKVPAANSMDYLEDGSIIGLS